MPFYLHSIRIHVIITVKYVLHFTIKILYNILFNVICKDTHAIYGGYYK